MVLLTQMMCLRKFLSFSQCFIKNPFRGCPLPFSSSKFQDWKFLKCLVELLCPVYVEVSIPRDFFIHNVRFTFYVFYYCNPWPRISGGLLNKGASVLLSKSSVEEGWGQDPQVDVRRGERQGGFRENDVRVQGWRELCPQVFTRRSQVLHGLRNAKFSKYVYV